MQGSGPEPKRIRALPIVIIVVVLGLGAGLLAIQRTRGGDYVPPPSPPEAAAPAPGPAPDPMDPPSPPPAPLPPPDPEPKPEPEPMPDPKNLARKAAEYDEILKEVESLKLAQRWSTGLKKVQAARDAYPEFADRIDREIVKLNRLVQDAVKACDKSLARARGSVQKQEWAEAMKDAITAISFVPDMEEKVQESGQLVDEIKRRALQVEMVRIPAGQARVGDPVRTVPLGGFRIDATEVTNEQYHLFVLATNARRPDFWPREGALPKELANKPVAYVTAEEAEAFARWAGKRLPSEEEWERAARFVDGRMYPWGDSHQLEGAKVPAHCFDTLIATGYRGYWADVKSHPNGATPEGVYDLAGNVWEWTASSEEKDGKILRVLKGGSFLTDYRACRGAARLLDDPGVPHIDVGFRCVMDLEGDR
jgi:formylglycine-generating enzyme required for sulfatase activity